MKKEKKALSPVVATVLLIAMVVVIALIIFLWLRGFVGEKCQKFGEACDLVCDKVQLNVNYENGILQIVNNGNYAVNGIKVKRIKPGQHDTIDITTLSSNWQPLTLGKTFSSTDLSSDFSGYEKIMIIPVILGTYNSGEKEFACPESSEYEVLLA